MTRRAALRGSALSAVALAAAPAAAREAGSGDFAYEITRSDAEWKARLSEDEYAVLREGSTELPKTSPLWNEERAGRYRCRGCDLTLYSSDWKAPVDKGWVFFKHAQPNAVLTGIDGPQEEYGMSETAGISLIEVHCRRCGSHLGHILKVEGEVLNCINGTSLTFHPEAA